MGGIPLSQSRVILGLQAQIDPLTGVPDILQERFDAIDVQLAAILALLAGGGVIVPPTLGTVTLSGSLQIGTATSGNLLGTTALSSVASNIPGIAFNSGARTYSGTPTGSAQTIANGIVETLAGAVGSPKSSPITVAAAVGTLSALGLSSSSFTVGTPASGTITGATAGSTIAATGLPTGLTVNGAARTFAYDGTGSAGTTSITLTETLVGYSNSPLSTGVSVTVAASGGGTAPTLGAIEATPQASPTAYPPAPTYAFPTNTGIMVGDKVRIQTSATFDFASLAIDDATVTLTGTLATDTANINAKLSGITSGVNYIRFRAERSTSVFGEWSVPVLHGTATVPAMTSNGSFTTLAAHTLVANLTFASPIRRITLLGEDMIRMEIAPSPAGSSFTLRWIDDALKTYSPPDDFDQDRIYKVTLRVEGLNGAIRNTDAVQVQLQDYVIAPNAFTFADVVDAERSTVITSNTITVAGMAADYTGTDGSCPAGTTYSKNGGAFVSTSPFSYTNGDTFTLKRTSSSVYYTTLNSVFALGPTSDTWSVTTKSDPAVSIADYVHGATSIASPFGTSASFELTFPQPGIAVIATLASNFVDTATLNGVAMAGDNSGNVRPRSYGNVEMQIFTVAIATAGTKTFVVGGGGYLRKIIVSHGVVTNADAAPVQISPTTAGVPPTDASPHLTGVMATPTYGVTLGYFGEYDPSTETLTPGTVAAGSDFVDEAHVYDDGGPASFGLITAKRLTAGAIGFNFPDPNGNRLFPRTAITFKAMGT